MISGGQTGSSHITDHLALLDPNPFPDPRGESIQMEIGGPVAAVVTDLHNVAIPSPPLGLGHQTVTHGDHGSSAGRGVIDAVVWPVHPQYGMKPVVAES